MRKYIRFIGRWIHFPLCTIFLNLLISASALAAISSDIDRLRDEVSQLHSKLEQTQHELDQITTRVLQDKVQWNGDYTAFIDSFVDDDHTADTHDTTVGIMRHRFRLGLRASPTNFFRFTGRLAAYKNFISLDAGDSSVTADRRYSTLRPTFDSLLRIDRMYVDIFPSTKLLSFSFGIFPNTEGLPDLHRLQPRKSTFPNLFFNTAFAGAVAAVHPFANNTELPETHFWYIYTRGYDPANKSSTGYQFADPTRFALKKQSSIHLFLTEFTPKVRWAETLRISAAYGLIDDYQLEDDSVSLSYYRTATSLSINPGVPLGNMDRAVLYGQVDNIAHTGFNAFVGVAMTQMIKSTPAEFNVTSTIAAANAGASSVPYKGKVGILGSIFEENKMGKALYTGVSYDLQQPINGFLGASSFGYEFFLPERRYLASYSAGDDIVSRLETSGTSHKFFLTQPLGNHVKVHLAYTLLRQRYTNNLVEIMVPAQGPGVLSSATVVPATTGSSSDAITRYSRLLHFVQLAMVFSF